MKLKQLESALSSVKPFSKPNIVLEQYATPPSLAARMLYTAESVYGDLDSKFVADLGCGCGMLTFGSIMLGATVTSFDIDDQVFETVGWETGRGLERIRNQ
jgi:predicted RNA methylase